MRILLVNTSDNMGGAAVACQRLMNALTLNGVEVRMLVRDKYTDRQSISKVRGAWWKRLLDSVAPGGSWCKAVERVMLMPFVGFSWKKAWAIDVNWLGTDITGTEEFKWADIIHLHWVNQGMLSLNDITKIVRSGKKVVWTLHDAWCSTSLCHLTLDCKGYLDGCNNCSLISCNRLATDTWKRKRNLYQLTGNIHFTTCSKWLRNSVKSSSLMHDMTVSAIPNPIDTGIFHPQSQGECRKLWGMDMHEKIILFVAQRLDNPFKGVSYLVDALQNMQEDGAQFSLAILGSNGAELAALLPGIKVYDLGYQTDPAEISTIYSASDVFVLPSLSENLPNTIMEAMACGVPCVGFDVGGIPEMIDHEVNGMVAETRNASSLAEAMTYCLNETNHGRLSDACVVKVMETYSQKAVAEKFINIYNGCREISSRHPND